MGTWGIICDVSRLAVESPGVFYEGKGVRFGSFSLLDVFSEDRSALTSSSLGGGLEGLPYGTKISYIYTYSPWDGDGG
jgi:hypothetical protein